MENTISWLRQNARVPFMYALTDMWLVSGMHFSFKKLKPKAWFSKHHC
jgi:hypothetical protein